MTGKSYPFQKDIIIDQIQQYRKKGENAIRTGGVEVDEILAKELGSSSRDTRNGVSIIGRPPPEVAKEIRRIQRLLLSHEPGQYSYPSQDLHATVLEVAFGRTPAEVTGIMEQIQPALPALFHDLPSPVLEAVGFGLDAKGCAINFVPRDDQMQALRTQLQQRLEGIGIPLKPRYSPDAAHVSFFRYIGPMQTEKNQWADILINTPVDTQITWKISSLYFTWGANWYGNWSRVSSVGPFCLTAA